MNHTTSYVSPADRRHLSRRTLPPSLQIKPWNPADPGALHAQRLMESWFPDDIHSLDANRRDAFDRRKNATPTPSIHWPRRVAWILGAVFIVAAGISLLLNHIPNQSAPLHPLSYTAVHAQYQWLGFHRFQPSLEWPAANGAQRVFPT